MEQGTLLGTHPCMDVVSNILIKGFTHTTTYLNSTVFDGVVSIISGGAMVIVIAVKPETGGKEVVDLKGNVGGYHARYHDI